MQFPNKVTITLGKSIPIFTGDSPLAIACYKGGIENARCLLEAGASTQFPGLVHITIQGCFERIKKANRRNRTKKDKPEPNILSLLADYNCPFDGIDAKGI